ncbi:MAG: DUF5709 domain-containing protein [Dermatophilaceae bacterium]
MSERNEHTTTDLDRSSIEDRSLQHAGSAQLTPEDTLVPEDIEDPLDRGYSPPDTARGSRMHGVTAAEQARDESIEERLQQEVPDPISAYGAPDNESGLNEEFVGGADPDAIPAEDDWLGDGEVGAQRAGRLVAPDEGGRADTESDLVGEDVGVDGAGASAEEAAVHVVYEDDRER